MTRTVTAVVFVSVLCVGTTPGAWGRGPRDDPATDFEVKIRPVLAGTCFPCHGGKKTSQGLRVDSRAALLRGGEGGPAVVPGDPARSLLVRALRHDDDAPKMPPEKALPDAVVADFAAWVAAGAPWPETSSPGAFAAQKHWAFAPVRPAEPPPDPAGWSGHPIDRFLAARWREHGLKPAREADRRTLIRRVTVDLTGLPPTPEEVRAFVDDPAPDAWERLVDRLLASPLYGERWGRHWLDVARFADTAGDNADYPVPEARLYRDYVIDAFNADKPYDAFVREQLAGDLLAADGPRAAYAEEVVATGFLALSRRYATAPFELWHLTIEDAIETTGRAFLGLTLRCARCHDHKFDPVTTADYYALYGIFASTRFPYAGSEEFQSKAYPRSGFVPLVPACEAEASLAAQRRREREAVEGMAGVSKDDPLVRLVADLDATKRDEALRQLALKKEGARLRELRGPGLPPDLPGAYAVGEGRPTRVAIQRGGDPGRPGPEVPRGVPAFLAGEPPPKVPDEASGRLELARWLTRPDHPLTSRVMVNRIWQHHFGRGIVATPSNLGLRGAPPTHPELLDWLAARFVAGGWSVKAIHRLILTSRAYRLAAADDPSNAARDPANAWRWRADRRRLDAESIRDAMLAVGGHLRLGRPGPHPFPTVDQWHWTQHNPFKAVYPSDRRSVYLMTQRLQRHPFLALFDGPDTNASTESRTSSTVPLQALFLMNNPFVRTQAEGFADRLLGASDDPADRVRLAHELAYGRPPTGRETSAAIDYIGRYVRELSRANAPRNRVEREAWTSYARVLLSSNEFFYLD
ncbi:MAG TPA: PSD1 and planctomycete cytochrome C domain-containing protein [Isosphaeraceae bacterium]|jgi:hypothetical protein|nr:PSD1 and planctomycete cytochrome C domain-containing protein [Isosphaeraceae bacterium]